MGRTRRIASAPVHPNDMLDEPTRYTPFAISHQHSGEEVALVMAGELDMESADILAHTVSQLRAPEVSRFVLDLRGVEFIDSSGLRVLLALRNDAIRDGHALTLVPPPPAVERIFDLTATRGLFDWRRDRPGR